MAQANRNYEPEFKQKIVRLVLEEGRTIKSVNEEYSLGEGSVRGWIRKFKEECEIIPENKDIKVLYEENLKLRKQLEKAKKENDFLKKSSRILRKGNRLEQYHFIDKYQTHFGLRWLIRRFKMSPNT